MTVKYEDLVRYVRQKDHCHFSFAEISITEFSNLGKSLFSGTDHSHILPVGAHGPIYWNKGLVRQA